jgi:pimeloyl-ACP methyl ester carboxylesterase
LPDETIHEVANRGIQLRQHTGIDETEKQLQRRLIRQISSCDADRQNRLALFQYKRGTQGDPRTFPALNTARVPWGRIQTAEAIAVGFEQECSQKVVYLPRPGKTAGRDSRVMERSGRNALNNRNHSSFAAARVAGVAGTILLAGCTLCNSPSRQVFPDGLGGPTCYSTLRPMATVPLVTADDQLARAKAAERNGQPECLGLYVDAALLAWSQLEAGDPGTLAIYRESVARLLAAASRTGRLDPRGSLTLTSAAGRRVVPINYYGFPWKPGDFCQLLPASDYTDHEILHRYVSPGVGVSLVAVRWSLCEEKFFVQHQPFSATAVLRPCGESASLDLYNPLAFDSLCVGPRAMRLDRDLTASLAYARRYSPHHYVEGFLDPGDNDEKPKLVMMEPYQPGKIPVIFIHGLGSEPVSWTDAVNRLRADAGFYRDYQFWFFRYPTGGDLLRSATALRELMLEARETYDPRHADRAFEQIVLVGHSMGGLVAQLQVTYSYDLIWMRAARRPIEWVRAPCEKREELRRNFYFDPSPLVTRVVFIATPHRGSSTANRLLGRAASRLVRFPPEDEAAYRQLMDANRDIFTDYMLKGQPTAIDLLEPDNPLLAAMAEMPFSRHVKLHSIIGDRRPTLNGDGSDGVVPVSSARLPAACSERFVSARHERMHKVDDTVAELERILREHAAACRGLSR